MVGKSVHRHRKRQDMTTHEKDEEKKLSDTAELSSKWPHEYFTCVSHTGNMRVSPFKLFHINISTG